MSTATVEYHRAGIRGVSFGFVSPSQPRHIEQSWLTTRQVVDLCSGPSKSGFISKFQLFKTVRDVAEPVAEFARLVNELTGMARREWLAARSKMVNVSLLADLGPRYFETILDPATIENLSRLGAGISIVLYPPRPLTDSVETSAE